MKKKSAGYLGGVLILALTVLAVLAVSCGQSIFPKEPAEAPVPTIAPPQIPHSLEGVANCRLCHEAGIGGAPQFPIATHSKRPSDVCLACHEPASVKKPASLLETTPTAVSAKELFSATCAACHGANRQGISGLGKVLTPESLAALSDIQVRDTILNGRPGTAMPAFKGTLSPEKIDALLQLIKHTSP